MQLISIEFFMNAIQIQEMKKGIKAIAAINRMQMREYDKFLIDEAQIREARFNALEILYENEEENVIGKRASLVELRPSMRALAERILARLSMNEEERERERDAEAERVEFEKRAKASWAEVVAEGHSWAREN